MLFDLLFICFFVVANYLLVGLHNSVGIGTTKFKEEYSTVSIIFEHGMVNLLPLADITIANKAVAVVLGAKHRVVDMDSAKTRAYPLEELNNILSYAVRVANVVCHPRILYTIYR